MKAKLLVIVMASLSRIALCQNQPGMFVSGEPDQLMGAAIVLNSPELDHQWSTPATPVNDPTRAGLENWQVQEISIRIDRCYCSVKEYHDGRKYLMSPQGLDCCPLQGSYEFCSGQCDAWVQQLNEQNNGREYVRIKADCFRDPACN